MTPPNVAAGLDRCRRLGARRVVVFSYFLFTGVLEERIREQSEAFVAEHPDSRGALRGVLRPDERIADLLMERYARPSRGTSG
jgi:sirohydrochlorin cobaltochelatase